MAAVVVNDFELLPAEPAAPKPARAGNDDSAASRDEIEPCEVEAALRSLEAQALRVWAH